MGIHIKPVHVNIKKAFNDIKKVAQKAVHGIQHGLHVGEHAAAHAVESLKIPANIIKLIATLKTVDTKLLSLKKDVSEIALTKKNFDLFDKAIKEIRNWYNTVNVHAPIDQFIVVQVVDRYNATGGWNPAAGGSAVDQLNMNIDGLTSEGAQDFLNTYYPNKDYANPQAPYISASTCGADNLVNVSPAEVCTLDQIGSLGIYDSQNYIDPNDTKYTDLKTYNKDKDNKENRTKSLCKQSLKGDSANLNCVFEHGAGYIRKPGDPDSCIVYECPPGFERSGNDCKKILLDAKINKEAHCDERWDDWFMIPNYHLGNTYDTVGDKCYAPCPPQHVPYYAVDPADGSRKDFFSTDKADKCVARNIYFNGKYQEGSEYCPLAWIYRLSATPQVLNGMYKNQLNSVLGAGSSNVAHNSIYTNLMNNTLNTATNMVNDIGSFIEDVTPISPEMQMACANLYTQDRLQYAYDVCKSLKDDEDSFRENLTQGDTSGLVDQKIIMLKQAANSLFCPVGENADDTPFVLINKDIEKDTICFPSVGSVDPSKVKKTDDDGNITDAEYPAPTADPGEKAVYTSLKAVIYIIMIPILLIILYYFWKWAGPLIIDLLATFYRILFHPINSLFGKIAIDIYEPGRVAEFALKWKSIHPECTINVGQTPSWRLYSRKWSDCDKLNE
jgi:hypothetical protein